MSEEIEKVKKTASDIGEKAKKATASAKEGLEHLADEASHATANISESITAATQKTVSFFEPITSKVKNLVLGLGEIIVTFVAVVGIASAIINGLSDMATIGFFAGLSGMFQSIVSVVMATLIVFLLFAIKDSLDKK